MVWFKRYWPWLVALFWLGGFELYAIVDKDQITLSRMVWRAQINFPALTWIVSIPVIVLLIHFFVPKFNREKK